MGRSPWAIVDFVDDENRPRRLVFRDPVETIVARRLAEVPAAIDRAETLAKNGKYVVGYVAYDAAPAFEPKFEIRTGFDGDLVWFAAFDGPSPIALKAKAETPPTAAWTSSMDAARHAQAVETIIEDIRDGAVYQVNLTARLSGDIVGDPVDTYRRLVRAQQGKYSAFIDTGTVAILSVSPELFFRRQGDRLESRPMKGTARRGRWLAEDDAAAIRLQSSDKERAENVMIVDLIRNDMGRIAVPGTVDVASLFEIERYPTVLQMTSHVKAQLAADTSLTRVFGALFPCGSVTGAPKIAASKSITALELEPRGVYCGSVGMIQPGGDAVFNVAIRTTTVDAPGRATYGTGGGITIDSNPAAEYRELMTKADVLGALAEPFDLFETMRLEGGTLARLDRHLDRLSGSARYFGFSGRKAAINRIRDRLSETARQNREGCFRVRATLSRTGENRIDVVAFDRLNKPRRVRLALTAVDSSDPFLYHKTTLRAAYADRLRAVSGVDDVLLFNERGELTETTIGNLVVDLGRDQLVTPPLESGLLPGIMRQELLEQGEIVEAPIPQRQLDSARRLWTVNSLRGWVPLDRQGGPPG